jgi:hypothetical protein
MYCVLVDKTEGEAMIRVKSVEEGQGLLAYQRMYKWFSGTTGLALTERTKMVMSPVQPRREDEIADAVDKWREQVRALESFGDMYKLSLAFKVTALKSLMVGKAKEFFDSTFSTVHHRQKRKEQKRTVQFSKKPHDNNFLQQDTGSTQRTLETVKKKTRYHNEYESENRIF